jgi:hypothetical protein
MTVVLTAIKEAKSPLKAQKAQETPEIFKKID